MNENRNDKHKINPNKWDFKCQSCDKLDEGVFGKNYLRLRDDDLKLKSLKISHLKETNNFLDETKDQSTPLEVESSKASTTNLNSKINNDHNDHHEESFSNKNEFKDQPLSLEVESSKILTKKSNSKDNHHDDHEPEFSKMKVIKLILGWILLFPLLWSIFGEFTSTQQIVPEFFMNSWFQFSIVTIIVILIGSEFIKETIKDARNKKLSVEILVTISSSFAYIYSTIVLIIATVNGTIESAHLFFGAAAEILVIIYSGRYLEFFVKNKAFSEIKILTDLIPQSAILIKNDENIDIDPSLLKIGDIVLVKRGSKIPSDGTIIEGSSIILEASFTGEISNFEKIIGDKVIGGTISTTNQIKVRIDALLSDSLVVQIVNGIQETKDYRAKTQNIADKIASYLIPSVFILSLVSLMAWGFSTNDWNQAIEIMITIMVIACPCSLGLTTPTSILVGSSVASNLGIFFNSKNVFESFKKADVIVFDKTGTLTTGELKIIENNIPDQYLQLIKEVEQNFTHPIAKVLSRDLVVKNLNNKILYSYEEIESKGLQINYNNETLYFGSQKYLSETIPDFQMDSQFVEKQKNGNIFIYLFTKTELKGYFGLGDSIKETTYEAIERIKSFGIEVLMVTGDSQATANYIGQELNISLENIYGDILPLGKKEIVEKLQIEGKHVIFVGDGTNDAAAMKQSDLSISMKSGADIAVKISDVTILENDLRSIEEVIYLSRKTLFNIYRGFGISISYNVIAIPLAMTGLLSPLIAAIMMAFSDLIAIFNSLTLRLILHKKGFRSKRKNIKQIKKYQEK